MMLILLLPILNHSNQLSSFLSRVSEVLISDGYFIFEVPSVDMMFLNNKWDQIYHEHISYFTSKNIKSLLEKNNFKIVSIKENGYHGGSLRTIAVKKTSGIKKIYPKKLINSEINNNIYKVNYYKKMMKKINMKKENLLKSVNDFKKKGYKIVGIGAGAKSNTFLTYYGLNNTIVDFLTDASKFKQNKLTPITRILIKDDKEIAKYNKIACIILSWNISNLVINKIKSLNKKVKIIYT